MKVKINKEEDFVVIKCSTEEQETTVSITRNEQLAVIYTCDNNYITKLKKVFLSNPSTWECYKIVNNKNTVTGYVFKTNKKNISFRGGKLRELSEEKRKAISERFKNYHKQKTKS